MTMKSILVAAMAAGVALSAQGQEIGASTTVRDLAATMREARPDVGRRCVEELRRRGEEGVRQLVAMLRESNDAATVDASFALEALTMHLSRPGAEDGCRQFAATLAALLDRGCADDVSRAVLVKALQLCGGDAEVPALARQLVRAKVRDAAILALTAIGTPAARAALVQAAEAASSPDEAFEYVSAFAKLREPSAAGLLTRLLADASPHRRAVLLTALGDLGHAPSAEAMLSALKAESAVVRAAAAGALAKLTAALPDRAAAVALARRYVTAERSEASLAVLTDAQGLEASLDMLLDEALNGDLVRREASLSLIGCREAPGLPERLVRAGETAGPEALASLVTLLGRRGEASAREFVRRQLVHESAAVRAAAIGALPGFGGEAAVADLVSALSTCRPEDVPAYRRTLAWQQSDGFAAAVAAGVPRASSGAAKVALLELLGLRRAQEQAEVVFAALGDGEPSVRRAALKALETLARPADAERVLSFLVACGEVSERRAAMSVLSALGRADASVGKTVASWLGRKGAGADVLLLQALGRIGGAEALSGVLSQVESADAGTRDAAVRALSAWPDAGAAEPLSRLVGTTANATHRVLALRGLIRLSGQADGRSSAERVAALQRVAAQCRTLDERRLVLGALGDLRDDGAITALILPAFDTPELVEEASAAAVRLICPRNPKDSGMVSAPARQALTLVLAKCGSQPMRQKAQEQLGAMPVAGADVAFGKPVRTSCPQQGDKAPWKAVDGVLTRESAWFGNQWPSWFSVDLEEPQTIDAIRPVFYWDGKRSYAYTIEVSDDGANWRQVVDMSKNTRPATDQGVSHVLAPSVRARHVRLNILRNSVNEAVHLVELEVLSASAKTPPAKGPNLLLRQPVTAGSRQEQHYAPERVNDGRIGKYDGWHTDQCPTWIAVDMQQVADIDTVRVIFFWDGTRTYSYTVEVSVDGKAWTKVADNSRNQTPTDAQGIVHRFPKTRARYVRLNVTKGVGGRYVHVVELEAYAAGQAPRTFPAAEPPARKTPPLPPADAEGFIPLFNGRDLTGWMGSTAGYTVAEGGILRCEPRRGGKLLTQWQFSDFELRFDFRLAEGANNGLGIRTPAEGDAAYVGMELQIIDNDGYKAQGHRLQPWQHHGSIYGVVPARDGALRKASEWNSQTVIARGSRIQVILNGQTILDADTAAVTQTADGKGRDAHPGLDRRTGHLGWLGHGDLAEFRNIRLKPLEPYTDGEQNVPPPGFTALFNGKDLTGWKGLVGNPISRAKMTPEQLTAAQRTADEQMRAHWTVRDGVICFDGKGSALCTARDYGDFELLVDWKITPRGDSGIYLRGAPQVQIWDPQQWRIGSGGLYNNQRNPSRPSQILDNPIGQWNRFRIRMVGERVSVWLNGALVVDNVVMENYWDRRQPIFPTGQIELQNHNSPLWFRNIFIRELNGSADGDAR